MEVKLALDGQIYVESGIKIGHILEMEGSSTSVGTKVYFSLSIGEHKWTLNDDFSISPSHGTGVYLG